ncbi:Bacterio-opsin activator HTH domain protein [Halorhabdus utahensis DSM 12940]|uniref:Bacterio-opsin activator HTH domain protein n=1 Tax=Halorhabdus utahensis (strain DSM 12940 / JCM 11049 / AX-2) TaxID=519442 RepID=C7NRN6_HALUD|nr:helix-turn-helix domain-containing protein [Halorhabdus utahensis]ACV11972.1 Bacterio-opsin activator HTH domain protein [Halorhabdus utahensis DSM 12940]
MIACCTFDADLLGPTFEEHAELSVTVEGIDAGRAVPLRLVFWAHGVSPAKLDATLRSDRTVATVDRLSTTPSGTLYRSIHHAGLPSVAVYNAAIEHDALVLAATSDGDGWNVRLRIPDREELSMLCDRCEQLGIGVSVVSIRDRDAATLDDEFGLTTSQRELLSLAWDRGYFSIPRDTSLSELACELEISQQAASERLRRGLWKLVSNTVCEDDTNEDCGSC